MTVQQKLEEYRKHLEERRQKAQIQCEKARGDRAEEEYYSGKICAYNHAITMLECLISNLEEN